MLARIITAAVAIAAVCGCDRRHFFLENLDSLPEAMLLARSAAPPPKVPIFAGHTGRRLSWRNVWAAVQWADVVMVGERHDDEAGHRVELSLVREAAALAPYTAVSMEMLDRDEQPATDAFARGEITPKQFVGQTGSPGRGFSDRWNDWYQPIVEAARDAGRRVVAANAPRRYVKLARKSGYAALRELPEKERSHFFVPERILGGRYARRFRQKMRGHPRGKGAAKTAPRTRPAPASAPASRHGEPKGRDAKTTLDVEAMYRAQLLWDSTMAGSVAEALDRGATRVIHLAGAFHIDFDGGTVQYLLSRRPGLRILTVSMQPAASRTLRQEDAGRADIVIYTGAERRE